MGYRCDSQGVIRVTTIRTTLFRDAPYLRLPCYDHCACTNVSPGTPAPHVEQRPARCSASTDGDTDVECTDQRQSSATSDLDSDIVCTDFYGQPSFSDCLTAIAKPYQLVGSDQVFEFLGPGAEARFREHATVQTPRSFKYGP